MNFLFLPRKSRFLLLLFSILSLVSCANLKSLETKKNTPSALTTTPLPVLENDAQGIVVVPAATATPNQLVPFGAAQKVGLILGPGAIKAFAHIGALRELSKAKIPIVGIVGIELGALVGALYSQKGQIFEPEWQMMKMKEDDLLNRSLLGATKQREVSSIGPFLKMAFSDRKNEDARIPFACAALNTAKHTIYMMAKGAYTAMLPYCLPIPPLFQPFNQNIAAAHDLKTSADYLRSRGATYIILVNVINTNQFDDYPFWGMIAHSVLQQIKSVDYVIQVPLDEFLLTDFDKRKEMIQRGSLAAQKSIPEIQAKLGL